MNRLAAVLAAVGVALLVLAGWLAWSAPGPGKPTSVVASSTSTSSTQGPTTAPTSQTSTSSSSTHSPSPSQTAGKGPRSDDHLTSRPEMPPRERKAAVDASRAFLRDLFATGRDRASWWAQVKPQLTSQAAIDMAEMDPSWIEPVRLGRGGGVVVSEPYDRDSHVDLEVEVHIPTAGGRGKPISVFLRPSPGGDGPAYKINRYTLPRSA